MFDHNATEKGLALVRSITEKEAESNPSLETLKFEEELSVGIDTRTRFDDLAQSVLQRIINKVNSYLGRDETAKSHWLAMTNPAYTVKRVGHNIVIKVYCYLLAIDAFTFDTHYVVGESTSSDGFKKTRDCNRVACS